LVEGRGLDGGWSGEVDEGGSHFVLKVVPGELPCRDHRVFGNAVNELHLVVEAGLQLRVAFRVAGDVVKIFDRVEASALVVD
jgi:hypothetical protein